MHEFKCWKNVASIKWCDLREVQATMCTMLEDAEIEAECESHNDYEERVVDDQNDKIFGK